MIIKTCGLRQNENIQAISQLGVDWIGLIFYEKSPRYVGLNPDLPNFLVKQNGAVKRVGVFVNETFEGVLAAVQKYGLSYVQLHGGESAVYCATLKRMMAERLDTVPGIIRAFRVSRAFDFAVTVDYKPFCDYFIFDTKAPQVYGGTGHKFDWSILDRYQGSTPFLLSGGLGPDDAPAIKTLVHDALAGVDVNSRFELEPGLKDVTALQSFIQELQDKK
ncbi:MAG: phosphoribosylanthranilate isomerase [Bacteroidota bacterium]